MPGCKKGDLAQIRGLGPKSDGHFVTCVERVGVCAPISIYGQRRQPEDVWEVSGPWVESRMEVARSLGTRGIPVLPDRVLFPIRGDQSGVEDREAYKRRADAITTALTPALSHLPLIHESTT